jgi:hypothetical protein
MSTQSTIEYLEIPGNGYLHLYNETADNSFPRNLEIYINGGIHMHLDNLSEDQVKEVREEVARMRGLRDAVA